MLKIMWRCGPLMLALGALGLQLSASGALAQDVFPSKPLRMIACCTGFPETTARVIGNEIAEVAKQPVIVETKAGANGILASEYVAKAAPDGYTILIGTNSTHAANQSLYKKLPYDYTKDFVPLSGISRGMLVLVVNPGLPAKNIAELTALARKDPGKLNYGSGSSSSQAAMELYKLLAGINIKYIPYKTSPQVSTDIVGGRLDMMTSNLGTVLPLIAAGKLRALAVTGTQRAVSLPNIPTMVEAGVPDYELTFWNAAWVPANTPKPIVDRLNELFAHALKTPKVREYMEKSGNDAFHTTSDGLMKFQLAEYTKWRKIILAAGIEAQ